jgi:hypothetical protein
MTHRQDVPDLLEQFMEASGSAERWVRVRLFFQLDESAGPAISGFLQKISQGPFFTCRFKVARMEKFQDTITPYRIIKKYLVQTRPSVRNPWNSRIQEFIQQSR